MPPKSSTSQGATPVAEKPAGGRKWVFDFSTSVGSPVQHRNISEPPGFQKNGSEANKRLRIDDAKPEDIISLKLKRAWDIAKSPGKSMMMTAFMLFMSGNTINIFSIVIIFMALSTPVSSLFSVSAAFREMQGNVDLLQPKLVYILLNLCALGVGLYKCWSIGLLPTAPSDWVNVLPVKNAIELCIGAVIPN
mmetsp:Transcript_23651/g.40690  ORF Transcript_23651/g.40690 Transcript_23651/m.40690 type:complete len:192 (+) Transcript_23651:29-604(+)|eukprot:CAMPEP_0196664036 /NCGR_PEP_ID=MMETSP1086-20130531/55281_1 /TAXON_ID=77921 /ORGANISM="Cyanoptyche  gloeocystis , Strain SAG4.97" /LENGTH=191 /DNA_ID=CAMNT_0042000121 /DNA_START=20 /DNA_END=595 /DNA_ORIENTATION=+